MVVLSGVFYMFVSFALAVSEPSATFNNFLNSAGQSGAVYLVANDYIGWLKVFVVLTGISSILAFMVANMLMAARVSYALAREKLLPRGSRRCTPTPHATERTAFLRRHRRDGPPAGEPLARPERRQRLRLVCGPVHGDGPDFYAMVNVINIVFHARTNGVQFNWFMNGAVPIVGIAVSMYLLYDAFFKTYLALPFQTGTSVVLAWAVLVGLEHRDGAGRMEPRRRIMGARRLTIFP